MMERFLRFFLEQRLIVVLLTLLLLGWGLSVAPFNWNLNWLPRSPVAVDAIPDLGENQQIVFTEWAGRSPRDVEDQLTYPLTVSLLGVPGVREVRSLSMFGFSSIFIIFEEDIEFYWSRSRILEKLSSLPAGTLPEAVQPTLGPDATGLGQIFWYTLEGRDPDGRPTGGWDLQELRSVQDWYVRFGLQSAQGISEVASIGGHVAEYQVDVDPDKLRMHEVTLEQVLKAVRESNLDVGARSTEINQVEYLIRGIGFIKTVEDLEQAVVRLGPGNTPIRISDVATVARGPAERRGVLTLGGAEAVGGVVVVREGFNPLEALENVHAKIAEISGGLPSKAWIDWSLAEPEAVADFAAANELGAIGADGLPQADDWAAWLRAHAAEDWPEWLTLSTLSIEPFYDRTTLIHETLGTLNDALVQQILVTLFVIIVMLCFLRAALVISALLPLSVLTAFILMKLLGIDANVVALAGIAIAIGTIVDMGIIVTENIIQHLKDADPDESRTEVVLRATSEVASAILTAISTTVISFLPVFTMTGAEGKLFVPLAYTKTFVLVASIFITLSILPAAVYLLIGRKRNKPGARSWYSKMPVWLRRSDSEPAKEAGLLGKYLPIVIAAIAVGCMLAVVWEPLGPASGLVGNGLFVFVVLGGLLGSFFLFSLVYRRILSWALAHKGLFLVIPFSVVLFGLVAWQGFERVFKFIPAAVSMVGGKAEWISHSQPWVWATHEFTGLGREFMPPLDEGSFLWMPTTMPHASLGEALEVVKYQDQAIAGVPEVELVVGKIGRAETALDPAPVSMIETIIQYKTEYRTDESGRRINFRYDREAGEFVRDEAGELIPDRKGRPYRQWRDHIRQPQDIWDEIATAAHIPGTTSAPRLQPIETRLVMLQTGMRAPMGLKLRGPDLETLDRVAVEVEALLREVPQVSAATVNADRVVGKPYLEIEIDREAIQRHGLSIVAVQNTLSTAVGGQTVTTTVEGRERYPVRVRYPREARNTVEDIQAVLVDTPDGGTIPLREIAEINYVRGPQMIRSEDTFLVAYVTFAGQPGTAEVEVVEAARDYLEAKIKTGDWVVPAGVSWRFAGTYEHQVRAARTLSIVLPIALASIFLILYLQFKSSLVALVVFSSILVAWGGGFTMLYWYGQDWFLNFNVLGTDLRELFQLQAINLSVAVWVGFLALFGIAVDDGVVMSTYLKQSFQRKPSNSIAEIRAAAIAGGLRRLRPCLMTTATTILALLPVLTATGRGADIMVPMALPSIGGMFFVLISLVTVPVLYCWIEERKFRAHNQN
ncbi:MAG: efflux RND transporter permease subunit [Puniceicoccaceae bacterium]|nr:MAG: efflux RND transporter permease subunit [Puniceicoccaceae bacterium]